MHSTSRRPRALWTTRLSTTAILFANGVGIGSWAAAIPRLKDMLALSSAQLSLVLLAMAVGAMLVMPLAGVLIPRLGGSGLALARGSLLFGLAFCLPGFAPGLPVLIACAFLLGAVNGLMEVSMNAHATMVERDWGVAIMSSFHAAWSCGGLIGASLGGLLIDTGMAVSWQMVVSGGLIVAVTQAAAPMIGAGETAPERKSAFAWPERKLIGLCVIALFCMLMEGAIADWSAVYLHTISGLTTAASASGYALFAFAMLLGRVLGDRVVRRLGRETIILSGAVLGAAGIVLTTAVPAPVPAIIGFCLVGLGLSNMIPAIFSASAAMSSSPALGISMAATVGYAGFLLGPPAIGAVSSLAGLRGGFVVLIAAMAIIIPLAAMNRRLHKT
jgi:MFS family permease